MLALISFLFFEKSLFKIKVYFQSWKTFLVGVKVTQTGIVIEGYWKGATVTEEANHPLDDLDACYSFRGLEKVTSRVASITFKTNKGSLVCYGYSSNKFDPPLRSKSMMRLPNRSNLW